MAKQATKNQQPAQKTPVPNVRPRPSDEELEKKFRENGPPLDPKDDFETQFNKLKKHYEDVFGNEPATDGELGAVYEVTRGQFKAAKRPYPRPHEVDPYMKVDPDYGIADVEKFAPGWRDGKISNNEWKKLFELLGVDNTKDAQEALDQLKSEEDELKSADPGGNADLKNISARSTKRKEQRSSPPSDKFDVRRHIEEVQGKDDPYNRGPRKYPPGIYEQFEKQARDEEEKRLGRPLTGNESYGLDVWAKVHQHYDKKYKDDLDYWKYRLGFIHNYTRPGDEKYIKQQLDELLKQLDASGSSIRNDVEKMARARAAELLDEHGKHNEYWNFYANRKDEINKEKGLDQEPNVYPPGFDFKNNPNVKGWRETWSQAQKDADAYMDKKYGQDPAYWRKLLEKEKHTLRFGPGGADINSGGSLTLNDFAGFDQKKLAEILNRMRAAGADKFADEIKKRGAGAMQELKNEEDNRLKGTLGELDKLSPNWRRGEFPKDENDLKELDEWLGVDIDYDDYNDPAKRFEQDSQRRQAIEDMLEKEHPDWKEGRDKQKSSPPPAPTLPPYTPRRSEPLAPPPGPPKPLPQDDLRSPDFRPPEGGFIETVPERGPQKINDLPGAADDDRAGRTDAEMEIDNAILDHAKDRQLKDVPGPEHEQLKSYLGARGHDPRLIDERLNSLKQIEMRGWSDSANKDTDGQVDATPLPTEQGVEPGMDLPHEGDPSIESQFREQYHGRQMAAAHDFLDEIAPPEVTTAALTSGTSQRPTDPRIKPQQERTKDPFRERELQTPQPRQPLDNGLVPNDMPLEPADNIDPDGTGSDPLNSGEGTVQLASAKSQKPTNNERWLNPYEWRRANPNADWNDYFSKYFGYNQNQSERDQEIDTTPPQYKEEVDKFFSYRGENGGTIPFDKFKEIFPDATREQWKEWKKKDEEMGPSGDPDEDYDAYREHGLKQGRPPLSKDQFLRERPKSIPETPQEREEFEKLMTPEELKKYRELQLVPPFSDPGYYWDLDLTQDRALHEWRKRNPEKVWPQLPKAPAPEEGWPPGYQGSSLETGDGEVQETAARSRRRQQYDRNDTSLDAIMGDKKFMKDVRRRMGEIGDYMREKSDEKGEAHDEDLIKSRQKEYVLRMLLTEKGARAFRKKFGRDLTGDEDDMLGDSVERRLRNLGIGKGEEDLFRNLLEDNDRRQDTGERDAPRKTSLDEPGGADDAGAKSIMEPSLFERSMGMTLPKGTFLSDDNVLVDKDWKPIPITRRPNLLPITKNAETGEVEMAWPKLLDILGLVGPLPGGAATESGVTLGARAIQSKTPAAFQKIAIPRLTTEGWENLQKRNISYDAYEMANSVLLAAKNDLDTALESMKTFLKPGHATNQTKKRILGNPSELQLSGTLERRQIVSQQALSLLELMKAGEQFQTVREATAAVGRRPVGGAAQKQYQAPSSPEVDAMRKARALDEDAKLAAKPKKRARQRPDGDMDEGNVGGIKSKPYIW